MFPWLLEKNIFNINCNCHYVKRYYVYFEIYGIFNAEIVSLIFFFWGGGGW